MSSAAGSTSRSRATGGSPSRGPSCASSTTSSGSRRPGAPPARLAALVPRGVALRLFAACELLSSQEARKLGIVDEVVAPHKLLSRAESLAVRVGRSDRARWRRPSASFGPGSSAGEQTRTFAELWDAPPPPPPPQAGLGRIV